jgi:AraC family transcriptional regulator
VLGRWRSDRPDNAIRTVSPHPGSYRLALMMAPLEARIWAGSTPVWGGTIGTHRFRLCPPSEAGQWSRLSGCDIVNLFIPVALVDHYGRLRADGAASTLAVDSYVADRMVHDTVQKMIDAPAIGGPLAQQVCDSLVTVLVCYLLEHYARPAAPAEQGSLGGARLHRVLQHLAEHCAAPVSNGALAALCGMSEAHFTRAFHRAVGLPPHRYLLKLRLDRASAALRASDARVLDIAHNCGFASASHFARAFAAHFGVSPAEFRQRQRSAAVLGK